MQIYKAERAAWPVRVYNLLYEDSQEADKFSAAVAREVSFASDDCQVPACSWRACLSDAEEQNICLSQMLSITSSSDPNACRPADVSEHLSAAYQPLHE